MTATTPHHTMTAIDARYAHPGYYARRAGIRTSAPITIHQAFTYLVFHLIERPVKRLARRIAHSGQWAY